MRSSRTNLALLVLVVLAVMTGLAAFATGTPIAALPVVLHGLTGSALVVLAPWKAIAAHRGLQGRSDGRPWIVSALLVLLALLTLVSGFLQTSGAVARIGPFTTMQVHVGGGLLTLVVTLLHLRGRPVRVGAPGRRDFIRFGGLSAGAAIAWLGFEAVLRVFEDTGTLWENLSPDAREPGDPAQPDFCGWAGLGSVAIPHEFLGMPMA